MFWTLASTSVKEKRTKKTEKKETEMFLPFTCLKMLMPLLYCVETVSRMAGKVEILVLLGNKRVPTFHHRNYPLFS